MPKRPTVYDVAQRAGVSIATVSFAFSRPERVKRATLQAVLAAAEELGYVPSANARGLAIGRTGAIGIYVYDYLQEAPADLVHPVPARFQPGAEDSHRSFPLYHHEVHNGVELECLQLGYALLVGGGNPLPGMPPVIDVAGRADGLITFAGSLSREDIEAAAKRLPVVALGTDIHGPRMRTVLVDNDDGMRRLAEHLVVQHGCRRFGYLSHLIVEDFQSRYQSFATVLEQAGLSVPTPIPTGPGRYDVTASAVQECIERGGLPDAFVCATDEVALTAIEALAIRGYRVPDDVLVTGFDGIVAGRLARPSLTTVRQPMEYIGRSAVRTLVKLIEGSAEEDRAPLLPVDVLIRESCGCRQG